MGEEHPALNRNVGLIVEFPANPASDNSLRGFLLLEKSETDEKPWPVCWNAPLPEDYATASQRASEWSAPAEAQLDDRNIVELPDQTLFSL